MEVLTLNVWGLWLVSKKREERIKYIADALKATTADVVLLQEVWVDADAKLLLEAGKAGGLAHGVHHRSGMFGSGLVTLSRHPMRQLGFWQYAAAGGPLEVHHGDYLAAKGVGWVRLATPSGEVDVLNTHLHSNYSHTFHPPPRAARAHFDADPDALIPADSAHASTRVAQLLELAQVASLVAGVAPGSASGGPRPLVVGGDFNHRPGTLESNLWRQLVPWLRDAWQVAGKREAPQGNPEGLTCTAPGNTFVSYKQVPERIDYVWSDAPCTRAAVVLTHKTSSGVSLSDHFGLSAELQLGAPRASPPAAAATVAAAAKTVTSSLFRRASAGADGGGAAAAQARVAPSAAAGLTETVGQTALMGSAVLLEEGIYGASADAGLKVAVGGCLCVGVLYCAIALPLFMPWLSLGGWGLAAALAGVAVSVGVGVAVIVAGRIGDLAQQRALSNAYRLLRAFMDAHGVLPQTSDGGGGVGGALAVPQASG